MPSEWVRPVLQDGSRPPRAPRAPRAPRGEAQADAANGSAEVTYPLTTLEWRKDGSSSMAALMLLIALSIRLNKSLNGYDGPPGAPRPTTVPVTYDELQRMTGFARGSVSSGLQLLENLGAIRRVKEGRAIHYDLVGVGAPGMWCQLPQTNLLRADGSLSIKGMARKRVTLFALKVYVALAALRQQKTNTAAVSYTSLVRWTGVRRQEIGPAIATLIAWELVSVSNELDDRHLNSEDRSNRYRLTGLRSVHHSTETEQLSVAGQQEAQAQGDAP